MKQADIRERRRERWWTGSPGYHAFELKTWRQQFEWISIDDRGVLPHKAGVYIVITYDDIPIYVGSTYTSLRQRWMRHHRWRAFDTLGAARIAYLTCDDPDAHHLYGLELHAMRDLLPILNDRSDAEVAVEQFDGGRRFIPLSSDSPLGWKTVWKPGLRGGRPRKPTTP